MNTRMATCIVILAVASSFIGPAYGDEEGGDGLTEEQALAADKLEDFSFSVGDIRLPSRFFVKRYLDTQGNPKSFLLDRDSTPPTKRRDVVITTMLNTAAQLCDRKNWQHKNEGIYKPAQDGLAYLWGGKNHLVREGSSTDECPEELFGLDCSGMLYTCASSAGIQIPKGTAALQEDPKHWNKVIPADWNLEMIIVGNNKAESGDIISWKSHIGIVGTTDKNELIVFQSNGAPKSGDCAKNYGPKRGPRTFTLSGAISAFGNNYKLLRLQQKTSGN